MFSLIGGFVIDSIAIFDNALTNLILVLIVGNISYIVSYRIIGSAYSDWVINSKEAGSLIYWIIIIIIFFMLANIIKLVSFMS